MHDTRDYNHADRSTLNLHRYGDDSYYQRLIGDELFSADGNVYSTLSAATFDVFGSDGPDRQLGFKAGLSAWQSLGFDAHGIETQAELDASYRPTNTAAQGAGWLASPSPMITLLIDDLQIEEGDSTKLRVSRSGAAA